MSVHWVPKAGNGWRRVNMPGLEAFEGFLLTTCFWEKGLLFHDKTPFRVSPKLCYGLGGGNCVLCLNTLMFIWNGYVQVCLMLYSLKIIKLHDWIINFVSPLEAVPECPFQSAVLQALQFPCTDHRWRLFLSLLAILWNSAFKWVYLFYSALLFASSLFTAIHPQGKETQKGKMAVWGSLTNSCEKKWLCTKAQRYRGMKHEWVS